jgi:hypothetical protein
MIYFLSGLLIIHGIVCLVGAFFPLYPPVFLFYVFFPGHFAIRLIIVLIIGAAQLVYGVYLALGKRWRVKWYWPAIATVVITGLLLVFPVLQNPGLFGVSTGKDEIRQPILFKETLPVPAPDEEVADDIIPTPGGLAYRANVHQHGVENPWPPIESTDVVLGGGLDALKVSYRDYIKTEAGETRNNIVRIRKEGGLFDRNLALYSVNVPTGITLTDGGRGVGLPATLGAVLVIEISPDVQPGEYSFGIDIEIDGKNYGTIPCTVNVVGNVSEFQYQDNHGITTTRVEPEAGENVTTGSALMVRLTLEDLIEKSDAIVIGKVVDIFPARTGTEPLWSSYLQVFTDVIIETERYLYGEPPSAYIAVRVAGGRAGEIVMCVEDEPVFNLGEEAILFLTRVPQPNIPPEGIVSDDYYRVTGAMQGKLVYRDGQVVTPEGNMITISELEEKIAGVRGN